MRSISSRCLPVIVCGCFGRDRIHGWHRPCPDAQAPRRRRRTPVAHGEHLAAPHAGLLGAPLCGAEAPLAQQATRADALGPIDVTGVGGEEDPGLNGESFNFGPLSQLSYTVEELLQDLSKCWDFENASTAYKVTDKIKFHEAGLLKLNCDKALFHLKWVPTLNYEQLVAFTGSWYFSFYNHQENMLDFTLAQIGKYEQIAISKENQWMK